MLTARGDEIDEVVALEVGADDYMSKPVRPRALLARLRVHLRRAAPATAPSTRIEVNGLRVDSSSRIVHVDELPIDLTTAEFDLLWLLARHAGSVISRDQLYQQLHGVRYDGIDRVQHDWPTGGIAWRQDEEEARREALESRKPLLIFPTAGT